jgi:hypothetical protein
VKVIGIVQKTSPMYVISIDIPFKGSQSRSNKRSKVTAVPYLHSGLNGTAVQVTVVSMTRCACHNGVIDTAVPCASESDFLIKQVGRIVREDIRKKVGCTAVSMTPLCISQQCH